MLIVVSFLIIIKAMWKVTEYKLTILYKSIRVSSSFFFNNCKVDDKASVRGV